MKSRSVASGLLAVLSVSACAGGGANANANTMTPETTIVVGTPVSSDSGARVAPEVEGEAREGQASKDVPVARDDAPIEVSAPRHRSKVLDGPARPSKIRAGDYLCRVDAMYRLRPCAVTLDQNGFTWLETPAGLLHLKGVLYDDGGAVVFDGTSGNARPFGCFSCQERCTKDPSSCGCRELLPDASRECLANPITVRLTKKGQSWVGTLSYKSYLNHYEGKDEARHVTSWDTSPHSFLVEIAPAPKSAAGSK